MRSFMDDRGSRRRWPAAILLGALLFSLASGIAAARADEAAWKPLWDHWYTLEIGGAPAGWMREAVSTNGEQYRLEQSSKTRISRAQVELEITAESVFIETVDGAPIELRFEQDMGRQTVNTSWRFEDDHVQSVSSQGGRELRKKLPLPEGEWLTPMAARRYWLERVEAGATSITFKTLSGEQGLEPVTMVLEREDEGAGEDKDDFVHEGRAIPITRWRASSSALPGIASVSQYSQDGHLIHDRAEFPFGEVTTRLATREAALAAGEGPAPELLVSSVVPVAGPIANARSVSSATLRLRVKQGEMPALPSAGAQRVEPGADPGATVLRVDMYDNLPASLEEREDPAFLEESTMVDATDPLIKAHARRACRRAGDDPAERADAMRAYVHGHISAKALDTAFASASETARTRTGDCSEHGVLLCAMLRADGIPARVASGLVYIDAFAGERNVFCWHMWTQALIDGAWVDLDATLDRRYDALHVLTGTSSLAEGDGGSDLSAMMMLIGNLEIEVADTGVQR